MLTLISTTEDAAVDVTVVPFSGDILRTGTTLRRGDVGAVNAGALRIAKPEVIDSGRKPSVVGGRGRYGLYDFATLLLLLTSIAGCVASLAQFRM